MLLAIPVYVIGLCALSVAWWCIQRSMSATSYPSFATIFPVYATTQFAKYLPGNVGQYVGRHVLLRRWGFSHATLLVATLAEAGMLLMAATVIAATGLDRFFPGVWKPSSVQLLVVEAILLVAGVLFLRAVARRHRRFRNLLPLESPAWLIPVLPLHLFFFAIMALTTMLPAHAIGMGARDVWLLPSVTAASWIAGFLVIGAPGGLGVREATFLVLLRGTLPETDILVLAAAFRVATFAGDGAFFLLGLATRAVHKTPAEATGSP